MHTTVMIRKESVRIALATCDELPELHWDEQPLRDALARRGVEAVPSVWSDRAVDWAAFDACVIRNTWDYTGRLHEFLRWADALPVPLYNPARILRWNAHKGYLGELDARGVPVVPTEYARAGAAVDLAALAKSRGWDEVVVKPCISAGARDTFRVRAHEGQAALESLRDRDRMVQPYQPAVEGEGEHSLIFVDGQLGHAIRKNPQLAGNFGEGGEPRVTPAPDELAAARLVLDAVGEPLLYARVDLVRGSDGVPRLMELEAFEPRLFLGVCPETGDRLAEAIVMRAQRPATTG
jgi:glutathione synthase/RimK-type ligase-like ATP-grasp enzyme